MRSGEITAKFFLPGAATKATRRDALFQRQSELMRANPEGALDLVCALKAANPHGIYAAKSNTLTTA